MQKGLVPGQLKRSHLAQISSGQCGTPDPAAFLRCSATWPNAEVLERYEISFMHVKSTPG